MTPKDLPIHTSLLQEGLPHRQPMIWIDTVTRCERSSGQASVNLTQKALIQSLPVHLRDHVSLELMAQAFGYIRVCQTLMGFLPPKPRALSGFLAQVRNAEFFIPLANVKEALIEVEILRSFGDPTLARCRVLQSESKECIASAEIKIFLSAERA